MDGPVFRFLSLMYDLMILNIIYVITCIPVITIGAATSALYRTMLDKRYGLDAGVKTYLRQFLANFRQSTPRFLLFLLICAVLAFDARYAISGGLPAPSLLFSIFLVMLTVAAGLSSWVLALTGQFDNTLTGTLRNAALLTFRHLPLTLLLLLRFLPLLLAYFSAPLFLVFSFLFFLFYYSLAAYLAAGPMSRIFLPLMSPEEREKRTRDDDE